MCDRLPIFFKRHNILLSFLVEVLRAEGIVTALESFTGIMVFTVDDFDGRTIDWSL